MTVPIAPAWQPIASAPKGQDILVHTRTWGPIIVNYSEEFSAWLSRMQVPVSINETDELPRWWLPLPATPDDGEATSA